MRAEDGDYIKHRLSRSLQALDDAECLLGRGSDTAAVNRVYYAVFYAASALLLSEGHASSKHSGVLSLFNRLWVKTGRLPRTMGSFYVTMFDRRQKGDYQDLAAFEKADVMQWIGEARTFVDQVLAWFRDNEGLTLD
jgi:uncharacterized protein